MLRRRKSRRRGRRYGVVAAALAWRGAGRRRLGHHACGSSGPTPVPSTAGVPMATIAGGSPTASPTGPVSDSCGHCDTSIRDAGAQLSLVDSCNPKSVRSAIPVTAPASEKAGSFTLHVPILMYHRIVPSAEAGDSIPGLVVPRTRSLPSSTPSSRRAGTRSRWRRSPTTCRRT